MPVVINDKPPQRSEAMNLALKRYIMRQRQKQKEEQEADAEVERQRKEKERQLKQDKMTLGETREQIAQLVKRIQQLKEEKHQLFLQLKKVLNEDDNRKKQLIKDSTDANQTTGYPGVSVANTELFLQQNVPPVNRNPVYKTPASQTQPPEVPLKRRRSPSPVNYSQRRAYKPATNQAVYQKADDIRRGQEYARAVLWNKPYGMTENSQYGPFYTTSANINYSAAPVPAQGVFTYGGPQFQPPQHPQSAEPSHPIQAQKHHYMTQQRPHNPSYLHMAIDSNAPYAEENFYPSTQVRPTTHVPLHGGSIPIQQPPQGAKTGGITSGYPIRPAPTVATVTPLCVYPTFDANRDHQYSAQRTDYAKGGIIKKTNSTN